MPKEQNQTTMRKVYPVIRSLILCYPNHHFNYSFDCRKCHTILNLKLRQNVVYNVTNIKQHELLSFDTGCQPSDVIPKGTILSRIIRRHAQPFLPSHSHSKDNRACCNLSRKGVTRSVQASKGASTQSSSRSQNLVPNSNAIEPSPSTSRAYPKEDTKRSQPLDPDIFPFETDKDH